MRPIHFAKLLENASTAVASGVSVIFPSFTIELNDVTAAAVGVEIERNLRMCGDVA